MPNRRPTPARPPERHPLRHLRVPPPAVFDEPDRLCTMSERASIRELCEVVNALPPLQRRAMVLMTKAIVEDAVTLAETDRWCADGRWGDDDECHLLIRRLRRRLAAAR